MMGLSERERCRRVQCNLALPWSFADTPQHTNRDLMAQEVSAMHLETLVMTYRFKNHRVPAINVNKRALQNVDNLFQ